MCANVEKPECPPNCRNALYSMIWGRNNLDYKSNDFIDKIVRFVYNIIEKEYLFHRMIMDSSRKEMVVCLLPQQN